MFFFIRAAVDAHAVCGDVIRGGHAFFDGK